MANILASMVIFFILVNLSAGVLMVAIIDIDGNPVFDETSQGGYAFNDDNPEQIFINELEQTIQPAGSLEDKGDQIYRVLDMMSLGFIYKFVQTIDDYMYGVINIFDNILGQYLEPKTRVILFGNDNNNDLVINKFGVFKILITMLYILYGITLFTGKDVVQGT